MLNIQVADINHITPGCNQALVTAMVPFLNKYLPQFDVTTVYRLSNFIGQAAEETAGFRTFTEYASGAAYEGRHDLGNTEHGDGVRFKGRGIFMITGRTNYGVASRELNLDLINNPLTAASPEIAVRTACLYWKTHSLNAYADKNDQVGITKRINGGTNGLADRELCTNRAIALFTPVWSRVWTTQTNPTSVIIPQPETVTHFEVPVIVAPSDVTSSATASPTFVPPPTTEESIETWVKKFFS